MEKKVIFRDRQELQATDLGNIQNYTEKTFQDFVQNVVSQNRLFVGFTITSPSATEIQASEGQLWDGAETGNVYVRETPILESVIAYMPVVDERWLTLSIVGQINETDIEPRDFLIDLQSGQTEPQQVAMLEEKVAELHISAGLESSDPQKQNPPTGYTLIGYVRLSPSGVEEIQMAETNKLVRLFDTWLATKTNREWIDSTDPQIASIKSDIASLAAQLAALKPNAPVIAELTRDVAGLKDLQGLPDAYSTYGSDWLLDNDESDVDNVDYEARAEEGARFPWANMTVEQPDLFNPYADEVENHNGFILPAYTDHVRLDLSTEHAGNIAIGQYQYTTHEMVEATRTRTKIQYGPTRTVCSNSKNYRWLQGVPVNGTVTHDGVTYNVADKYGEHGGRHWYRVNQYWKTSYTEKYMHEVTKTYTINGSQIAQTFLAHQSGWLTGIDLFFDVIGADGDVHMNIVETAIGMPDLKRSLNHTVKAAADLKKRPVETFFEFEEPLFVEAGKLYAIVLTTQGTHSIALTQGTNYTQGTLFYSTDGVYHQGDFKKDFMMRLHFARFLNPRTTVELTSLGLDGGIADLDFDLECTEPANTEFIIEYRKEGDQQWYPINETTADQLLGKPPLLHLRAVFQGDEFVMPGLSLPGSTVQAARPAEEMRHISIEYPLPISSDSIDITLRLEGWNSDKHTCVAKLREGDTLTDATSVSEVLEPNNDATTVVKKFTFALGAAIDAFQIQVEGTSTTELELFHVAYRHHLAR